MTLPNFKTLMANVTALQRLQGRKDATDYLRIENNKRGHTRCTGQIVTTSRGNVVMTVCDKWDCWRCGSRRLWKETQRILLATQFMQSIGDVYAMTIFFDRVPAVTEHEQQKLFARRVSKFLDQWQKKAKRNGQLFLWVLGHGIKQTTGGIHAHMICNYIPDDIEARAKKNNLKLWIETARSPEACALYIRKNLEETMQADIMPKFRRVKTSQYMPKLRRKADISALTKAWYRDYGHGDVRASFGGLGSVQIPIDPIDDVLKLGATVTSSTESITRKNEVAQKTLSYIHTQTPPFRFYEIIPTVQCCRCKKHYPRTNSYFLPSKRNKDNLTNNCIHCIEYDRNRDKTFKRKIDKRRKNANHNARCKNKLTTEELLSYWHGDYTECLYCDVPIHIDDDSELDHINGTKQHRGLNVIENVGFCHPECHQHKTNSGLDGRSYGATIGRAVRGYAGVVQKRLIG